MNTREWPRVSSSPEPETRWTKIGWNSWICNNPDVIAAGSFATPWSQAVTNGLHKLEQWSDSKSAGARNLQISSNLLNMFQQIVDSRGTPKVVGDATNSVEAVWKENHYMLTKRRLNPSWNSLTYYESTSVNRSLHQPSTINHHQLVLSVMPSQLGNNAMMRSRAYFGCDGGGATANGMGFWEEMDWSWLGLSTGMTPQRWF